MMPSPHLPLIRRSLVLAQSARDKGNHPFGALLVDAEGTIVLEAENTVETDKDCTKHAETNLVSMATQTYSAKYLASCTLYSSTEPCPMCAGAIFWGNIRAVVFGLSESGLYDVTGRDHEEVLYLPCRDVFKHGAKKIQVTGPLLEEEAKQVHLGFWS